MAALVLEGGERSRRIATRTPTDDFDDLIKLAGPELSHELDAPLSVLRNLAIVVDDPVAGCARTGAGTIAAAPTRRSRHQHRRRSPELHRPPPKLPTTIPRKRKVDVGQQPQRRPAGRCRSVCLRARWNWRRLARAPGCRVLKVRVASGTALPGIFVSSDPRRLVDLSLCRLQTNTGFALGAGVRRSPFRR